MVAVRYFSFSFFRKKKVLTQADIFSRPFLNNVFFFTYWIVNIKKKCVICQSTRGKRSNGWRFVHLKCYIELCAIRWGLLWSSVSDKWDTERLPGLHTQTDPALNDGYLKISEILSHRLCCCCCWEIYFSRPTIFFTTWRYQIRRDLRVSHTIVFLRPFPATFQSRLIYGPDWQKSFANYKE